MSRRPPTPPRALVEGALLAAIAAVVSLLVLYVPLGAYLVFVAPTPVAVAVVRHGLRLGTMAGVVAALIMLPLAGPLAAVAMGLTQLGVGLPLGAGLRRQAPAGRTIALTALGFAATAAIGLLLAVQLTGVNPLTEILALYERSADLSADLSRRLGLPPAAVEQSERMWQAMLALLRAVLPAALLGAAVTSAFVTYLAGGAVLRRLGHPVPELPPFADWQLPAWVSWTFTGLVALGAVLPREALPWAGRVLDNLFYLFNLALAVNGLATAHFFLRRWQVRPRTSGWLLALAVFAGMGGLLMILGWIEPLLRLREAARMRPAPGGPGEGGAGARGSRSDGGDTA